MKTPPPILKKTNVEYFVVINDEQTGPYDFEKIKLLIEFKNISNDTSIWKEGMNDWDVISNLEEFTEFLNPVLPPQSVNEKRNQLMNDSGPEVLTGKSKLILKNNSTWLKWMIIVTFLLGLLSLIGSVHQYITFQNTKEIDLSYVMPFSGWGALLTVLFSLFILIYSFIKKQTKFVSIISMLIGVGTLIFIFSIENKWRSFWQPLWDSDLESYYENSFNNKKDELRNGWRSGAIDTDSLNELIQLNVDHAQLIGNQIWKIENLNVDKFQNGDYIPEAKSFEEWADLCASKQPAFCYYQFDPSYGQDNGKLYNWYAVNDKRGLAPNGWKIPSSQECKELLKYSLKSLNEQFEFNATFIGEINPPNMGGGKWLAPEDFFGFFLSDEDSNDTERAKTLFISGSEIKISSWFKSAGKPIRCLKIR